MSVNWVAKSDSGGRFGLTFCPGKTVNRGGVRWSRSLEADLERLKSDFGVTSILCLLSQAELTSLKLRHYAEDVQSKGISLLMFPIVEMGAPESVQKTARIIERILAKLKEGEVMIIHCRGGVGRAGLIASCLLLQLRMATSPTDAISKIRKLRCRGAVESYSQEQFIAKYANFIRTRVVCNGERSIKWEVFPKKTICKHAFFLNHGSPAISGLQEA